MTLAPDSVRVDASIAGWADAHAAIWTGHQPRLWHPGILAKYLAVDAVASGAGAVNLVVDHDLQDALTLSIPVRNGNAWSEQPLRLGAMSHEVPTGCQPGIDTPRAVRVLREQRSLYPSVSLDPLIEAWSSAEARDAPTLGRQVAAVLGALMRPWLTAAWNDTYSSEICEQPWFADELQALLQDAAAMASAYNRGTSTVPEAGVNGLGVSREWIELPVWLLGWNRPRQRVFADVSDSSPWLIDERGKRLDWETRGLGRDGVWLAPKALWMTALIRRRLEACGGFVHGTGGAIYDRAMEHWWSAWRDEPLAPMGLATADLTLDLPGPIADHQQLAHAIWHQHHLPHNLDRDPGVAPSHPELVAEKARLLATMDDDRDRKRRRVAFDRIHAINAALADAHHVLIDRADNARRQVEIGLANSAIRRKRDWCFALHPELALEGLRESVQTPGIANANH
ncbi:MAG: hypothetical protein AAGJ38_03580 [Planctomycetota bacterium]